MLLTAFLACFIDDESITNSLKKERFFFSSNVTLLHNSIINEIRKNKVLEI